MKSSEIKYVDLITSLPHHGDLFSSKETSISKIRLDIFLKLLSKEDMKTLLEFEDIINAHHKYNDISDQLFFDKINDFFSKTTNNFIKEILVKRIEITIIIGLLRKKILKKEIQFAKSELFFPFMSYLKSHSELPDFGLSGKYKWIIQLNNLIEENNSVAAERILLAYSWEYLSRISYQYEFSFEAIILYVTRWNIVNRWTIYDSEEAKARLNSITNKVLEEYLK